MLLFQLQVILTVDIGKSPLARNNDLLTARELIPGATKGFLNDRCVRVFATNGKDDLADVDTGNGAVGLAPCATHTSLQPAIKYVMTNPLSNHDSKRTYPRQHRTTSC